MIINNNTLSVISNQMLAQNTNKLKKSTEKLSTGYRINRAADGAADLTISMKMRYQIRGLDQASDNIDDGISLLQVADGAMAGIQSVIDRMSELSVKAANDTNQSIDRESIQDEMNQLQSEIVSITDKTEFNGIKILQGNDVIPIFGVNGGMPLWTKSGNANSTPLGALTDSILIDNAGVIKPHVASYIDFTNLNASNFSDLLNNAFHTTCCTCDNRYSIKFVNTGNKLISDYDNYIYEIDINGVTTANDLIDRIMMGLDGSDTFTDQYGNVINTVQPQSHYTQFAAELDNIGNRTGRLVMFDERDYATPDISQNRGVFLEGTYESIGFSGRIDCNIQTGANTGDAITFQYANTKLSNIGLSGNISVASYTDASNTLSLVSDAKENVSRQRSRMGALQNRLEFAKNNANSMEENVQKSESKISDLDIAAEMVKYSEQSILAKAGESLMVHSNSLPEGILMLLKK